MKMSLMFGSLICLVMTTSVLSRNVVEMEAHADEYQDKIIQEVLQELMKSSSKGKNRVESNGFSWSNCGSPSDWVNVSKLSLAPDPLAFPSTLTVAGVVNVTHSLEAKLALNLVVKKKVLGLFIEVPCIDNVGSCDYDDICEMLKDIQCPQKLIDIGINCRCPISNKLYTLEPISFDVGAAPIPSGEYKIEATLKKGTVEAACLKVDLQIKEVK